jgi:hypothetical protein
MGLSHFEEIERPWWVNAGPRRHEREHQDVLARQQA